MNEASAPLAGDIGQPENGHLAAEEVLRKLDSLSAAERKKLRLIEERRRDGTDFGPGMLYQEALCQVIVGERRCPVEASFIAFLAQSMRSIASHRRKALSRQVPLSRTDSSGVVVELQIAADQLDPEQTLLEKEAADVVDEVYKLLEGDDEAQLTIMAIVDGKKGRSLRDELGITQAGYDYIMKRIRRAVAKKYPKGWPL
ncbi:MAG: sigma-70 family RNA polymerase sigma factor [Mesorhizobium sp.]|uniref:sigma-70 family RNA polymerase sigma factor n=1 Tax=Mesorhizobium sp. TaxID=1871066 RepID=UPI000FE53337|nr:sigma-70 family RNA polymerase sigma factor [Mesorhizobium sp.]RWB71516.1 MAG: sigma-70 family RNA polymerase sigma factor [Mesorhizobium sp.]